MFSDVYGKHVPKPAAIEGISSLRTGDVVHVHYGSQCSSPRTWRVSVTGSWHMIRKHFIKRLVSVLQKSVKQLRQLRRNIEYGQESNRQFDENTGSAAWEWRPGDLR